MRRALASLLLALWIAGVCSALLPAQFNLPACCRAHGKHHCAMHSQGDGFHADSARCPYCHLTALSSQCLTALAVPAQALRLSSSPALLARAGMANPRVQHVDSAFQRGPPLHLS